MKKVRSGGKREKNNSGIHSSGVSSSRVVREGRVGIV